MNFNAFDLILELFDLNYLNNLVFLISSSDIYTFMSHISHIQKVIAASRDLFLLTKYRLFFFKLLSSTYFRLDVSHASSSKLYFDEQFFGDLISDLPIVRPHPLSSLSSKFGDVVVHCQFRISVPTSKTGVDSSPCFCLTTAYATVQAPLYLGCIVRFGLEIRSQL